MSNLKPALIAMNRGLNLQSPKIIAEPGTLLDCLNYEQVDFQGQKRIDGFARYDGNAIPALDEYYVITQEPNAATANYVAGDLVASDKGLFGVVLDVDSSPDAVLYVAVVSMFNLPAADDSIYRIVAGANTDETVVLSITTGTVSEPDEDIHYTQLLTFNAFLRARIEELPGHIAGLHWFRDRLYAIAGVTFMSLDGTSPQIYPTDELNNGSETATVLDSFILGNTRAVFLDTLNPTLWVTEGTPITRDALSVGSVANGYETIDVAWEVASLFQSRTEQQVLEEDGPSGPYDFGWKFVHLGWIVNFENGISLYGSLSSLNQNVEGIGIQGPTSIAGTNGRPLRLSQKIATDNTDTQVNGWKSSDTPLSFELEEDDVRDVDTDYIYADAYIEWSADSVPARPGYDTTPLVEYPATNTIPLET